VTEETLAFDKVQISFSGPLARITLADPDRLNALTPAMAAGLTQALQEVAKPRRSVRAVLMTGEGRGFCAGVNLSGRADDADKAANLPALSMVESLFHPLIRKFRDVEVPVIAAVNGPCVGIGLAMMLLSDYVVAAEDAFFLVPFRNLASATDSGLSWLLPRAIGLARARQMMLRAERVPAPLALDWGLVNEVVALSDLAAASRRVADEFAHGPTVALGVMRRLWQESMTNSLDEHLELEARSVARTSRTKDNLAALKVFGRKDKPTFVGA
jgi:2-(1,2-epoxy-1,2-dihydrophenyl)acetyl-CoA isomerase